MTTTTNQYQIANDALLCLNDELKEAKRAEAKVDEVLASPPPPPVNEVRGVGEEIGVWMTRMGNELAMLKEHEAVSIVDICFISIYLQLTSYHLLSPPPLRPW